jgi:hypothetical protein
MKSIYEKLDTWLSGKNKPNSNPGKAKTKPISKMPKMNVNIYHIKVYNNETAFRRGKNKPNSNPISKQILRATPKWPESAKMAQRIANRGVITVQAQSIKKPLKKPNLLKINMLSYSHRPVPTTGTPFAHLEYMR